MNNSAIIASTVAKARRLTPEEIVDIEHEMTHYPYKKAVGLEALKIVQKHQGWVSDESLLAVSEYLDMSAEEFKNKVVIIVDDVANTGRTIFYAIKPLLDVLPKRVQVAVLVDRKHKSFPIHVDYVGLSLATTLNENIDVQIIGTKDWAVYLD